ncbi:MAG: head GIN domain-containing protein [Bacillota bacterium]
MRKSIAAAVIAASAATGACGQTGDNGPGPTVSRNYHVAPFQEIEVAGPYDVTIHTGANPGVSAQGGQKLLDKTVVQVQDGKLVIHPQEHRGFSIFHFGTRGSAKFTVTVPQLTGATIAGSGDIHVDQVRGPSFNGIVAGSGGLDVGNVEVQQLKLSIGGSGSAKARAGKAVSTDYSIGGSGDIDAGAVQSQQAKVSIAGSGSVKANSTGTADVSIMGSGDVDVRGGAKCTISKAGSGSVRCS